MATTLAQAKLNAQDDIDFEVIDEFQKNDAFLDALTFDDTVTPGTGGGSLTYGWRMLATERGAGPRDYNAEAETGAATRTPKSANLIPFGARYAVDRVLGNVGPAATSEVTLQMQQAIKSTRASVLDGFVNGATQTSGDSFEGLDELLTSAGRSVTVDWSAVTTEDGAHTAIDGLDDALSQLDGDPGFILGNRQGILRLRQIARRAGYFARERDEFGRQVESYAGIPFMDLGAKAGSSQPIIPVETFDSGDATANDTRTSLFVVRLGLDAFHGASMAGGQLVTTYLPNFDTAGAVKDGEVEMGPVAPILKRTKSAIRIDATLSINA